MALNPYMVLNPYMLGGDAGDGQPSVRGGGLPLCVYARTRPMHVYGSQPIYATYTYMALKQYVSGDGAGDGGPSGGGDGTLNFSFLRIQAILPVLVGPARPPVEGGGFGPFPFCQLANPSYIRIWLSTHIRDIYGSQPIYGSLPIHVRS